MHAFDDLLSATTFIGFGVVFVKIVIAVVLAAMIGYERMLHGRPAGMRTHMLMIMGVVLFSEVSKAFAPGDYTRIASQIVVGVGFLGAGTIMRLGPEVKGLTSAASLWATAALGMAVSVGGAFLYVAVFGTLVTLFTLDVVDRIEHRLNKRGRPRTLLLNLPSRASLGSALDALRDVAAVDSVQVSDLEGEVQATLDVSGENTAILAAISNCKDVRAARWVEYGGKRVD